MRGRTAAVSLAVLLTGALASCSGDPPSVLSPAGEGARRIAGLWWLMFWISIVVFVVVVLLIGVALVRARRPGPERAMEVGWGEPFIVIAGVIIPSLILAGVFVASIGGINALSEPSDNPDNVIEVIGHDWWWEVRYRWSGIETVTANEIHIPAGERVQLQLTTDDVIHSFWVPRLQAKADMTPGVTNNMWIHADEPGTYRGQCAEFCGLQHANMIFFVIAHERAEFEGWLANEASDAVTTTMPGERIFMDSTCVGCHTIRGTEADAEVGPDLTHLAGRDTIAAGVLDNQRANLERWIADPQSVKPGAAMPPAPLTASELAALLDYLESLH